MGALTQVLRWAAGAHEIPEDQDFDDRVLLDLMGQHALSGRLQRRLPAGPQWLRHRIGGPVAAMHSDTLALAEAHIRAVDRIVADLGEQTPPVVVKGIATGLLTGERHLLRCGDIDLVCADGGPLIETLTRLGYERTRAPFLHELGEFTREGVEIDVHAYLPVPGYGAVRHADLTPPEPPKTWYQPRRVPSMNPIRHGRLVDGGTVTVGRVSVPDPCLLAIVLCGHAFLNFTNMWSLSHRAKPYVKLAELADLRALVRHEAFDTKRFLKLVADLDAWDAVGWAGWASTVLLGRNPLPVPAGTGPFPRCLWWDFWARLPVDEETLLLPYWFNPATVIPLLPSRIELDTGRPTPPWTVEIRHDGGQATVVVGLPERTRAATERGRVDFGTGGTEWTLSDGRLTAVGSHVACDLLAGRRIRLRYRVPGGEMLVGVAEQDASGALLSALLLPVTANPGDVR
ncbi:nucleotidyltransferase family protein [Streptomyces tagetis]|uniref:Nucleotidyltransferase family protein n=1 Tax=Streptomyces tagetis TaxID=2820809 RepID=A0A940XNJ4_9ACTN|nr:nucleotidyltransferase family protein [Streptomyces sp. RG38]MBQ0828095.1 nucleotidyltransferase family protein [Streptomyces sp. RG38]